MEDASLLEDGKAMERERGRGGRPLVLRLVGRGEVGLKERLTPGPMAGDIKVCVGLVAK